MLYPSPARRLGALPLTLALALTPACVCFVRGTRVATPLGPRPIEDLAPGDEVWSFALDRNELVRRRVARALRARADSVLRLAAGEFALAGVTPEHPFWDASTLAWREARKLSLASTLLAWPGAGDPRAVPLASIARLVSQGATEVFNLTIEGDEANYFAEGILVHNKSPLPPPDADAQSLDAADVAPLDAPPARTPLASAQIGPRGGTVEVPGAFRVDVPAGALASETTVAIFASEVTPNLAPSVPLSDAYVLEPPRETFAVPIAITFTLDPARLPPGTTEADAQIASGRDDLRTRLTHPAVALSGTRVHTQVRQSSTYVAMLPRDCPPERGAFYEECNVACALGYHLVGRAREPGAPLCTASVRCERDEGAGFDACGHGCGVGYHATSRARAATCEGGIYCEASGPAVYVTCEQACRGGYREVGRGGLNCDHIAIGAEARRCEPVPDADAGTTPACGG